MKNNKVFCALILFMGIFCSSNLYAAKAKSNVGKTMYVCLDPATLMEKPSTIGNKVATANYGSKVIVIAEKSKWIQVKLEKKQFVSGWVPASAVQLKKITTAKRSGSANADEIALAGKGFSASIESEYASEFNVDYSDVNFVEKQQVSEQKLKNFLSEGNLNDGVEE